jgi:hypothetical protein
MSAFITFDSSRASSRSSNTRSEQTRPPPISAGPARPPKWQCSLNQFASQVPTPEAWPVDAMASHIDAALSLSISEVTASPSTITQLMKAFNQQTRNVLSARVRDAYELVFLAACVVLAHPSSNQHKEEVMQAARHWYYDLALKNRTISDRWNGMKWIGLVCTELFPSWGRRCHDLFILCMSLYQQL